MLFCLCWGFTAQSTQWGHVERGQFTSPHRYRTSLVLQAVNQYCAHSFARNWQLPFLNQRKGENDRRKYFMINLHERMLQTTAGVEPAISWSPFGRGSNWATEADCMLFKAQAKLCVCVCACVRVCMCVCVHTHARIHQHTYVCSHRHIHMFVCISPSVHSSVSHLFVCLPV